MTAMAAPAWDEMTEEQTARWTDFHPTGRAALAARHNRPLDPGEPLAEARLGPLLAGAGWRLDGYDDPAHRFLALATRG